MALAPSKIGSGVEGAVTQIIILNCDASAAVGELVRQDLTDDSKVVPATNNTEKEAVLGRIKEKPTPTTAAVVLRGVIDVVGLGRGRVYLGPSGEFTVTLPAAGYRQILGYSFGNGKLHFEPSSQVTKLAN